MDSPCLCLSPTMNKEREATEILISVSQSSVFIWAEWMSDVVLRSLEKDWFPSRKISTTTNDLSINRKMGSGTDRALPGPVSITGRDVITPVFILAMSSHQYLFLSSSQLTSTKPGHCHQGLLDARTLSQRFFAQMK